MLRYEIKLTDDNFKQEELVWGEKYLALDLSFVSGVTSQDYHLEKFKKLPLTNSIVNNMNSVADLETVNVTREGYIIIKGKHYEVSSGSVVDYSVESSGTVTNYNYLFINGKYYYSFNNSNFIIDDWLVKDASGNVVPTRIEVGFNTPYVEIDTIVWIEDGIVSIDEHDYFFDRYDTIDSGSTRGAIKYYEDGDCLESSAITECNSIEFHPFESASEYIGVTKFILTKQEEIAEPFDRIGHCKYFFYLDYKSNYLPISCEPTTTSDTTSYYFKCDIPNHLLKLDDGDEYYETKPYYVYHDVIKDGALVQEKMSGTTLDVLLPSNISTQPLTIVDTGNTLADSISSPYITVEGMRFGIKYDIMSTNNGKRIAIYLTEDASNFAIGDTVKVLDTSSTSHVQYVHGVDKYGFNSDSDTDFVLFNGKKYEVMKNICDKVMINGNEYIIEYNNKKILGKDCLVLIGTEKVPMLISSVDGAGTLTRYGKIVVSGSNSAVTATYDIIPYDGIIVNNKRYLIYKEGEDTYSVELDKSNEYTFIIEDIIGSSMLVCSLDMNTTEFTDEFIDLVSDQAANDVVGNQLNMTLYVKNKIFGVKEITQNLVFENHVPPFTEGTAPTSSDDYFDLFDSLVVFSKNGYIHIPLLLGNHQGNNMLQDNVVENKFFEAKTKEAINPIVDMEKDVYLPKYIYNSDKSINEYLATIEGGGDEPSVDELRGAYIGSYTDFHTIREIRVNPHFRTRDLDSWKVNEAYNNIEYKGGDNWFVLDIHPYKNVIDNNINLYHYIYNQSTKKYSISAMTREESLETLYNMPDLCGLLYFTDDDIYFQKKKVAKSFLRFSYYDTINKQTQSLLGTSAVFMDEHKLFKTFIDNSRKNVSDYGIVTDAPSSTTVSKVAVNSEYLGGKKDNKTTNTYSTNFNGVIIDDNHRIGSEFVINNKIETSTSSEGYYLYIFREYSENLTPKPIYMKVEFNHAGVGRTIPFLIPMKWSGVDADYNKTPISALTFSNSDDLELLKGVIRLADVYAQTYIPLYAVYDFKNKEYAYVFDDRYVTQDKDNVVVLNMFELKIMDENTSTEQEQKDITYKRQPTAIIDVNKKQFPII